MCIQSRGDARVLSPLATRATDRRTDVLTAKGGDHVQTNLTVHPLDRETKGRSLTSD